MSKLGRRPNSEIRNNIVELLFFMKESYGYNIYKKYVKIFGPNVSIRSIYYHLTKGVELGIFQIRDIQQARGEYSWGDNVQRVIFSLGKEAKPRGARDIYEKICRIEDENKLKK